MVAFYLVASFCLLSLTPGASSQTIVLDPFNKSLTESACPGPSYLIAGERIVLTALLNTSDTDRSSWPLTNILLKRWPGVEVTGCQINIETEGCHGYRTDRCGYCARQEDTVYHLVFNFTAVIDQQYFYVTWVGSSSNVSSSNVYIAIKGGPYSTTSVYYQRYYTAQDIARDTLVPSSNYTYLATSFSNSQPGSNSSWGYASLPLNHTSFYSAIYYDVTDWDDHLDDQININYQDVCLRTWLLSAPVTGLPQLDCDLPVMTRSNSTGTQIALTCRFPSFRPPSSVDCGSYGQILLSKELDLKAGSVTCMFNISDVQMGVTKRVTLYIYVNFVLNVEFTNGTLQAPRVVRFHVNGLRSVTVDPRSDVILECKVYGNPTAVAVIVGTGMGRLQEQQAATDRLQLTLTDIQCNDTGRYTCQGVNSFGTTSSELRGYVDINVRCPIQIESYVPNNKDKMFYFEDETDPLVAFKVYGYPPPEHFGLQLQQGTTWVNVSREFYSCSYSSLTPSLGLVTLLMSRGQATTNQTYMFTVSNGNPESLAFQFQLVARPTDSDSESTPSPWLAAFIAVMCLLGVCILAIIIIIIVIYMRKKPHGSQDTATTSTPGDPDQQHSGLGQREPKDYSHPVPDNTSGGTYHQPLRAPPSKGIIYENREVEECVYENQALDNVYELTDQG